MFVRRVIPGYKFRITEVSNEVTSLQSTGKKTVPGSPSSQNPFHTFPKTDLEPSKEEFLPQSYLEGYCEVAEIEKTTVLAKRMTGTEVALVKLDLVP